MTRNTHLLGAAIFAVCALPIAAQAQAIPVSADVSGGYSYLDTTGGGGHLNDGNINGAVMVPLGASHFNVQVNGAYDGLSGSGVSGHIDNISGTVFYEAPIGRIGATVGYGGLNAGVFGFSGSVTDTTFGGFGEIYDADKATAGVKGGDIRIAGSDVGFVGGKLTGYFVRDLGLDATIDYASVSGVHATSYGVQGEYLVSEKMPISVFAGYNYATIGSVSGHANVFSVGLKVYFGKGGALVDRQRSGPDQWGADQSVARLLF